MNKFDFIHVPKSFDDYSYVTLCNYSDTIDYNKYAYDFNLKSNLQLVYITPHIIDDMAYWFRFQNIDVLPLECCFYIKELLGKNNIKVNGFFYSTRLGQMFFLYDIPFSTIEKTDDIQF